MAPKSNNMIPSAHFHKDWQRFIKTWFDQPTRKQKKRLTRVRKANKVAPRPTGLLRPAVRCPSVRYHTKLRPGRGFTLEEISRAGLCPGFARSIGIAVDPRRRNKSVESILINVQRLKEYKSKLILFPLNKNKLRKGEANVEERKLATQLPGTVLPIKQTIIKLKARPITEEEKKYSVFAALRKARADVRLLSVRAKRLRDAADAPELAGKQGREKKSKKQTPLV